MGKQDQKKEYGEASTVQGRQYNKVYNYSYRLQMQEHLLDRVKKVYNNNATTQIAIVIEKSDFFACF